MRYDRHPQYSVYAPSVIHGILFVLFIRYFFLRPTSVTTIRAVMNVRRTRGGLCTCYVRRVRFVERQLPYWFFTDRIPQPRRAAYAAVLLQFRESDGPDDGMGEMIRRGFRLETPRFDDADDVACPSTRETRENADGIIFFVIPEYR